MISAKLYRTAAIVFLLFAAGHTFGFLTLTPPTSEAIAVRDANGLFGIDFQYRRRF